MRTPLLVPGLMIITCTLLTGCTKRIESKVDKEQLQVIQLLNSGNWVVTKYSEQGHDATAYFSGFTFRFHQSGQLIVSIPGASIEGSWVQLENPKKFIINLGQKDPTNTPLGALSDNWVIISKSATRFNLQDDTGTRNEAIEFSLH